MTLEAQIKTVYANHLILNFGADALAMYHEIPHFKAFDTVNGVAVVVDPDHESALAKALELYAIQTNQIVFLNGLKFDPCMRMAA